jgi:hypothetical protein
LKFIQRIVPVDGNAKGADLCRANAGFEKWNVVAQA